MLVLNLLDHEGPDLDAHVLQVLTRHREDLRSDDVPIAVDLLDREGRAHPTDVTLERLQGDLVDLGV